jgi:hypothetical protein
MARLGSILLRILLVLLALPFILLAAWALVFQVPTVAVLAFTAAWLLLPLFWSLKFIRVLKLGVSFMLIPATLALTPMMIGEVNGRVAELAGRDRANPKAYSLVDKAGIYGLNIVMAGVAAPLYPEAARATFLLCFPPENKERVRVYHSEFGFGSARLRGVLRGFVQGLATDTASFYKRIEWSPEDYRLTNPEARYALALNQSEFRARAKREGGRWRIDITHVTGIAYPKDALVPLITRPKLSMEEGLFWVLQQCGWLHPYNAEWRFTVYSDDKRLR